MADTKYKIYIISDYSLSVWSLFVQMQEFLKPAQ